MCFSRLKSEFGNYAVRLTIWEKRNCSQHAVAWVCAQPKIIYESFLWIPLYRNWLQISEGCSRDHSWVSPLWMELNCWNNYLHLSLDKNKIEKIQLRSCLHSMCKLSLAKTVRRDRRTWDCPTMHMFQHCVYLCMYIVLHWPRDHCMYCIRDITVKNSKLICTWQSYQCQIHAEHLSTK